MTNPYPPLMGNGGVTWIPRRCLFSVSPRHPPGHDPSILGRLVTQPPIGLAVVIDEDHLAVNKRDHGDITWDLYPGLSWDLMGFLLRFHWTFHGTGFVDGCWWVPSSNQTWQWTSLISHQFVVGPLKPTVIFHCHS